MGGRGKPQRILCINCNICVNTLRRYRALELDIKVTALLCSWIYPQIITEDDYVCEICRDLAVGTVNSNSLEALSCDEQPRQSHKGHTSVCVLCGCSLLRRQSDKILRDHPTELHQTMFDIIESRVAPRQITASDKACHACWLRIKREARRTQKQVQSKNLHDATKTQSAALEEHAEVSSAPEVLPRPEESRVAEIPVTTEIQDQQMNRVSHEVVVTLPDYRRAANSNNRCVFPNCASVTLRSISDKLRATILSNHKYYVPRLARVCDEHLRNNSWEILYDSENSMDTFTAEQIQHVFSFVNAFNQTLDFENVIEMDDRVFEYWIGMTKAKFNRILEEVPQVMEMRRGSLGLAALLLKMRTGDSDDKIATLLEVPRRTLENLMDKVKEIISDVPIPEILPLGGNIADNVNDEE